MKPIHARAITLKTHGMSNRKIAKELGCAVGSVSNWTRFIYFGKKKIVNLCPHEFVFGEIVVPPSGDILRVDTI